MRLAGLPKRCQLVALGLHGSSTRCSFGPSATLGYGGWGPCARPASSWVAGTRPRFASFVIARLFTLSVAILAAVSWLRLRATKRRVADAEWRAAGAERRLREMERRLLVAERDGLTQVWARGAWVRRVERALDDGVPFRPAVVLIADLDYGHEGGDRVLRTVAARLQCHFAPDDLIGRWGGDEFMLALRAVSPSDELVGLQCEIAEPIWVRGVALSAAVSLGTAGARPGVPLDTFLRTADAALHEAKHRIQGRTGVKFKRAVSRWASSSTRRRGGATQPVRQD